MLNGTGFQPPSELFQQPKDDLLEKAQLASHQIRLENPVLTYETRISWWFNGRSPMNLVAR